MQINMITSFFTIPNDHCLFLSTLCAWIWLVAWIVVWNSTV